MPFEFSLPPLSGLFTPESAPEQLHNLIDSFQCILIMRFDIAIRDVGIVDHLYRVLQVIEYQDSIRNNKIEVRELRKFPLLDIDVLKEPDRIIAYITYGAAKKPWKVSIDNGFVL